MEKATANLLLNKSVISAVSLLILSIPLCAAEPSLGDAVRKNDYNAVKRLLDGGAPIDAKCSDSWTLLHWAAYCGYDAIASLLLSRHAAVNVKNICGSTPLHLASGQGCLRIVALLLANGANVGAKENCGSTPLHSAANAGFHEAAQVLLAHGAPLDVQDNRGQTPVRVAYGYARELLIDWQAFKRGLAHHFGQSLLAAYHPRCGAGSLVGFLPGDCTQAIIISLFPFNIKQVRRFIAAGR